jgi:predicted RNA binding protein YcfA (HicA-like mRNA interferase family)
MSKLPVLNAKALEKLLLKIGFFPVRQKGSHKFYRHPDGRYTTIPHHSKDEISRPLLRQILKEIKLSPEEYSNLIQKL